MLKEKQIKKRNKRYQSDLLCKQSKNMKLRNRRGYTRMKCLFYKLTNVSSNKDILLILIKYLRAVIVFII